MATDNKYDRQLRLWGAQGQKALSEAHVLLLGAGPAGTETLKNLVLPGVGRFTVVDGEKVEERDTGNNFFVRKSDVGRPRAAATAELLAELNPDVRGAHRVARVSDLVSKEPQFIRQHTLVVAAQVDPQTLQQLGELCWAANLPLVVCRTYGLLGSVRLQIRSLDIVESKSENKLWDLRLREPFPELDRMTDALDLDSLDDHAHAHVPWVLLLAKAAKNWRAQHNGASPSTRDEKEEFRKLVAAGARQLASNVPELNFEEAAREAHRAWADPRELPYEAQQAFDHARDVAKKARRGSDASASGDAPPSVEQLCLRSVDAFRAENNGLPPLSGPIPDMHADTTSFVALQRLYRDKALSDLTAVQAHFSTLIKDTFSRAPSQEDLQLLELTCKHVGDVRHVSTKSLADELVAPNLAECAFEGLMEIDEPKLKPQAPVCWYAGLRAVDRFYVKQGRYPGLDESSLAADASLLADELRAFVQEAGAAEAMNEALADAHAQELSRFGAAELHAVASVVGGVASQEAVKVIARQYEPVDHTYVFNGIAGVGGVVAV